MDTSKPKRQRTLLESTFIVSFMTITSRITGFLRDLVLMQTFGAASGMDAFVIAFKLPNFLRRLFAEGAFSQAFIPVLAEYRTKGTHAAVRVFLDRMAGTMITVLFTVTLLAVLLTPWLMWFFAPGFGSDPAKFALTVTMLRITFPYLFFISLTAFIGGILNSYGKFSVPAFTPNLLNFALIGAAIFMAPHFAKPIVALAWGVFIGGVVQLLMQLPFVWRLGLLPRPQLFWRDAGVKRVLRLMVPAIFALSVAQCSLFIDMMFASFLRTGSLSWIYVADRFTSFPLGVFGVAIATVVMPHLSRQYAKDAGDKFSLAFDWGLRFVLLIALPAALGIALLSGPILLTFLQYGRFTLHDALMAQRCLIAFSFGVPAFMLVKVLASGFYARQNIKTPVKIAIVAMLANVLFDATLIFPLQVAGLALATTLTSTVNATLLLITLIKKKHYLPGKEWLPFMLRLLVANGAMAFFLFVFTAKINLWYDWGWMARALHLIPLLVGAMVIYVGSLLLSGLKWREFLVLED